VADVPPIPMLEENNVRTGFFEEPELRAVLAQLPDSARPVVEFAALTGWRIGEMLSLQWRQADFEEGIVRLEPGTTKDKEGRTFAFAVPPELETVLRGQLARTRAVENTTGRVIPHVFHRGRGEPGQHASGRAGRDSPRRSSYLSDRRQFDYGRAERTSRDRGEPASLSPRKMVPGGGLEPPRRSRGSGF
jgi:integrase